MGSRQSPTLDLGLTTAGGNVGAMQVTAGSPSWLTRALAYAHWPGAGLDETADATQAVICWRGIMISQWYAPRAARRSSLWSP